MDSTVEQPLRLSPSLFLSLSGSPRVSRAHVLSSSGDIGTKRYISDMLHSMYLYFCVTVCVYERFKNGGVSNIILKQASTYKVHKQQLRYQSIT